MKDYPDVKIIANISEQKELIEKLEKNFKSSGWGRNLEKEKEYILKYPDIGDCFIFTCSNTESRPAAELSFHRDENGYLFVSNIVPEDTEYMDTNTYEFILEEFLTKFLEPTAQSLNIEIIVVPSERNIDSSSMSPEMAQLLKKFLSMANIADGGTHLCDEERLFDFIIQAHNEKSLLEEQVLKGLLIDNNWPEMQAQKIVSKYLFGKDLLNYYLKTKFKN